MFPATIHSTTRRNAMKTLTVIFTLATIIFAAPAVAAEGGRPWRLDDGHSQKRTVLPLQMGPG